MRVVPVTYGEVIDRQPTNSVEGLVIDMTCLLLGCGRKPTHDRVVARLFSEERFLSRAWCELFKLAKLPYRSLLADSSPDDGEWVDL